MVIAIQYSRNPERFSLGEGTEEDGASKQQCSIQVSSVHPAHI